MKRRSCYKKNTEVKITSYSLVEKFQINTFLFSRGVSVSFQVLRISRQFFNTKELILVHCFFFPSKNLSNKMDEKTYSNDTYWYYFQPMYFIRTIFGIAKSRLKWSTTYWEAWLQHHHSKKPTETIKSDNVRFDCSSEQNLLLSLEKNIWKLGFFSWLGTTSSFSLTKKHLPCFH